MVDRLTLLEDLQTLLPHLETDLRDRIAEVESLDARLRSDYVAAKEAARTAQPYEQWRDEAITQAAVAWVLGCVFVRFLEDNRLIEPPRLAGPGDRLKLARDHHTVYFQQHPSETDREYLLDVFRTVAKLPAARELFDERHNPLWSLPLSGDGAHRLLDFWQEIDPEDGTLLRDFTDPSWNTRFLGDLYQDLSEAARKKYALLQTPEFVEEFILDRTLSPAIEQFGYREVRLIDPTCGSGHFLLGAFSRLFTLHQKHEPAVNPRELAQRALDGVYGVDLNPFATAVARFRLLLAALKASGISSLADAPAFRINVATGDSLLHGRRFAAITGVQAKLDPTDDPLSHVYATEDRDELRRILGQQYHAVVGNPPYITVKDKALNEAYRSKYGSCSGKYSLSVPFMERFFELAFRGHDGQPAGFVGQITANSFMKREFGAKLIESFIPRWDLTHVVDTSGAYIPGHGTPTVILFGRHQPPVSETVRAVMGIRGEPTTPDDPARGLVWSAIVQQLDHPNSTSEWLSVAEMPRASFHKHPWSVGGGGATELKELLEDGASQRLVDVADAIGITAVTGEDDLYMLGSLATARRLRLESSRPLVTGDLIRDWTVGEPEPAIWLYDEDYRLKSLTDIPDTMRLMWPYRSAISRRKRFGTPMLDRGLSWYEWQELYPDKLRTPLSIAYAEVASHNHFVLDRGGKVFKQTSPVVKLPDGASEDDHLALLGLLNSSVGCFWLKQVAHNKGGEGIGRGIADEKWEKRFAFDATKLKEFPLPTSRPMGLAKTVVSLARQAQTLDARSLLRGPTGKTASRLAEGQTSSEKLRAQMIAFQEELDWECYRSYGVLSEAPATAQAPDLGLGERAFEIRLARRVAAGEVTTTWFERHGSTPITEIPARWPEDYRRIVQRRLELIETNPNIRLIEQPEYKRRWNLESWEVQQEQALRAWILDRLESGAYWGEAALTTCARLADTAQADERLMEVAEVFRGRADYDVAALVAELVASEAVPFLPVIRYKETGLRKREAWEQTWALQRREDAGENVGEIPVPPKYTSADFLSGTFWRLRGKLDVPRERFISYPGCERDADPSLVVGWAGWDHLQQAQALAGYYVSMKDSEGWTAERLTALLTGLIELLPWLAQWHREVDTSVGMSMAEYFRRFVDEEARSLELTLDAIRAWKPEKAARRRKRANRGASEA